MVTESMSLDEEGEDVGDGLAGDEGGWLVLGRGNGRANSIKKSRDCHILGTWKALFEKKFIPLELERTWNR